MKTKLWLLILTLSLLIPLTSYLTTSPAMETVNAAEPQNALNKPSLTGQALSAAEVNARQLLPLGNPLMRYTNETYGYQISFPLEWQVSNRIPNQLTLRPPTGAAYLTIEAVGPLSENLAQFVQRSLAQEQVIARQTLQINGLTAERVLIQTEQHGEQVRFYLDAGTAAYIISGTADRHTMEMVTQTWHRVRSTL